jgi:hypothetical protein
MGTSRLSIAVSPTHYCQITTNLVVSGSAAWTEDADNDPLGALDGKGRAQLSAADTFGDALAHDNLVSPGRELPAAQNLYATDLKRPDSAQDYTSGLSTRAKGQFGDDALF